MLLCDHIIFWHRHFQKPALGPNEILAEGRIWAKVKSLTGRKSLRKSQQRRK